MSRRSVQAVFRRRVGYRELGRLDRESAEAALHLQQARHRHRPPRNRDRRAPRLLPQPISGGRPAIRSRARTEGPEAGVVPGRALRRRRRLSGERRADWRRSRSNGCSTRRKAAGLLVDRGARPRCSDEPAAAFVPPDPHAEMHESLTGWWRVAEFIPKRHYNAERQGRRAPHEPVPTAQDPPSALIHESAYGRGAEYTVQGCDRRLTRRMTASSDNAKRDDRSAHAHPGRLRPDHRHAGKPSSERSRVAFCAEAARAGARRHARLDRCRSARPQDRCRGGPRVLQRHQPALRLAVRPLEAIRPKASPTAWAPRRGSSLYTHPVATCPNTW